MLLMVATLTIDPPGHDVGNKLDEWVWKLFHLYYMATPSLPISMIFSLLLLLLLLFIGIVISISIVKECMSHGLLDHNMSFMIIIHVKDRNVSTPIFCYCCLYEKLFVCIDSIYLWSCISMMHDLLCVSIHDLVQEKLIILYSR